MAMVRTATAGDAHALTDLYLSARKARLTGMLSARQLERENNSKERVALTDEWPAMVRSLDHRTFVLADGARLLGMLTTELSPSTGSAEMLRFHVLPEADGSANSLLQHALKDLSGRRCVAIHTWAYEADRTSRTFWERNGWRSTGEQHTQSWHGEALRSVRYVSTVALALAALRKL